MSNSQLHVDENRILRTLEGRRPHNVLVVDDEPPVLRTWCDNITSADALIYSAAGPEEIDEILEHLSFDAALVDLNYDKTTPRDMSGGQAVISKLLHTGDGTRIAALTGKDFRAKDGFIIGTNYKVERFFEKGIDSERINALDWVIQAIENPGLNQQKVFDRLPGDLNPYIGIEADRWLREVAELLELPQGEMDVSRLLRIGAYDAWPVRMAKTKPQIKDEFAKAIFFNMWSRSYGIPLLLGIGMREEFEDRYLRGILGGQVFGIPVVGQKAVRFMERGAYTFLRAITRQGRADFEEVGCAS